MNNICYNVLMSVYHKEKPDFFRLAAESMMNQTVKPESFVLVCDGKLTEELDAVIDDLCAQYGDILKVIRLPENKGLPNALNKGLEHCGCEYVARMDSDDVSLPDRVERQLAAMTEKGADICSGFVEEFDNDYEIISAVKTLPEKHADILEYARKRNPFNHPCVMFRKSAVQKCGGYEDYTLFEDYQLWVKMLTAGFTGHNIQAPLLKMRTGAGMYARRGGLKYFGYAKRMEKFKRSAGFSSRLDYFKCMCAKLAFCIIPSGARAFFYRRFLRK